MASLCPADRKGACYGSDRNGKLDGFAAITTSNAKLCLGNNWEGGTTQFPGCIDEVRISNVARTAGCVKATYDTITDANFASCSKAVANVRGTALVIR